MVVDASVLAKLFVAEEHSEEARRQIGESAEVWAPAHVMAELAEILSRKSALGEIAPEQGELALGAAVRLLHTVSLDGLVVPAFRIARELKLSVYDCLYLVLAELRSEPLVTADRRLLRGVQGSRFDALTRPLAA